ncbi:MAG TPA: dihydrofolate reductase family protein [Candidatus Acidoferrum sp.]|nr:dihydrofolate reductase family protein [Candidatus Acidoferrum sp.]
MNPLPNLRPRLRDGLPFVYVNVAITADGKLAPANRHFIPFSTKRDQELLLKLRTRCDAIIAGARTVDAVPVNLGPGGKRFRDQRLKNGLPEYNVRVVVSGSGSLDPRAEIFRHKFSPLIVLVSDRAPRARRQRLKDLGAIVEICGEQKVDFGYALKWLRKQWNVRRLLCEGGGEINAALFEKDLVDEVYVTACPTIFGGRSSPTLADGLGVEKLPDASALKLKAAERIGDEMYLVYSVLHQRKRSSRI